MSVKVALLGFGTVGKGTYRCLTLNRDEILKKTGVDIEIAAILEKNPKAIESGIAPKELFTQDFDALLSNPQIKIVIEMLGGLHPASDFMLKALNAGKNVVTPNKAAVAAYYKELHDAAKAHNVQIKYEASVCGAIPVIRAINQSLSADKITKVCGIVNGTTNYILTKMEEDDLTYEDALKQAQEKGFAEADPTADVEGIDAANKLSILMAESFGIYIAPDKIDRTGISKLTKEDIAKAKEQNCKIKLIACAEADENGNVAASVKPRAVENGSPLAQVRNEFNAVVLSCKMADELFFKGRGAGMDPTGSAVAGDIIELAKEYV